MRPSTKRGSVGDVGLLSHMSSLSQSVGECRDKAFNKADDMVDAYCREKAKDFNRFHSIFYQKSFSPSDLKLLKFFCRITKLYDKDNTDECLLGQANSLMRFFHEHLIMCSEDQTAKYKA